MVTMFHFVLTRRTKLLFLPSIFSIKLLHFEFIKIILVYRDFFVLCVLFLDRFLFYSFMAFKCFQTRKT